MMAKGTTPDVGNSFIIDTGATVHMCPHRGLFSTLKKQSFTVKQANGQELEATGIGTVYLESLNLTISDVYLVPELRFNLLSVSQIAKKGLKLSYDAKSCKIYKDGELFLTAKEKDGLYLLTFDQSDYMKCNSAVSNEISLAGMTSVSTRKVTKTKKVDRAFQRVYADVIGPLEPSRGGAKYYLLCVDSFTNYSWVYMMEKPQETLEKFQEFCDKVKNMHDANIDCLFTDEKQIFLLQKFQKFLDGKGIDHKVAVSQEAWNRGVCVKVNKELQKGMNAQLLSSHLPHEYWAESLASYLHVWLRKISKDLGCSPFEKLFNRKPSVAYFKVFGSHVRTEAPGGVKNARGIFVGYEKGLYRVILSESGQVILTKFLESAPEQERVIVHTFPTEGNSDDDDNDFTDYSGDDDSDSSQSSVDTVIERKSYTMDRGGENGCE
ncbi:Retrovirus-related Pol polyprotein from transposon TNT 1-94 [Podarcis lilfordi]|uniref:Retrovirus-related Pol polyprotein from transposon TNT 1-94 n=1 Tax=Podarcis lilfordi TaxID=74358 RepID=A0AA35NYD7_9SAUR|nr:Retrovirus-related Pol polyprotein from transposon TNT 1-94 [Podarcis lilfordi]